MNETVKVGVAMWALGAFVIAWAIAQGWKAIRGMIIDRVRLKTMKFWEKVDFLFQSGGMPSAHAASFTALTVALGCICGFESGIFVLAVGMWMIVVYDATHVRYAVGEQGEALNKLLKKSGKPELNVVRGHTLLQVVVGTLIGAVVGVGMAMLALKMPAQGDQKVGGNVMYSEQADRYENK